MHFTKKALEFIHDEQTRYQEPVLILVEYSARTDCGENCKISPMVMDISTLGTRKSYRRITHPECPISVMISEAQSDIWEDPESTIDITGIRASKKLVLLWKGDK